MEFKGVTESYSPWHLDVIKEGDQYSLILNAGLQGYSSNNNQRALFYGNSHNHLSFTVHPIMFPPIYSNSWDNGYLYRASLLSIDGHYRLYYSAKSHDHHWGIGLSEGEDIYSLRGSHFSLKAGNDLTDVVNIRPHGDITINNDKKIYTDKDHKAYISQNEIKLLNPNVAGARIRVKDSNNTVEIVADNGAALGGLKTNEITTSSLKPKNGDEISMDGIYTIRGDKLKGIKFIDPGVQGARLGIGNQKNSLKVYNDGENTTTGGLLEVRAVIISGTSVPAVEGAIRFNSSTKKHEGYDGTTWNPLY